MILPANTVAMRSLFWLCATNTHRKHNDSVCNVDAFNNGARSALILSRTKQSCRIHSHLIQLQRKLRSDSRFKRITE